MKLSTALENSGISLSVRQDPEITSITNDSRKITPGALFFALPGAKTDGSLFIKQALEKGAAAVISAAEAPPDLLDAYPDVAFITTCALQRGLSRIAANFYGNPSRKMKIYGITGTKGKTTTAYLLESILRAAGEKPGVIGTIDYRVDGKVIAQAANTTPLAHTLQELLAGMAEAGAKAAVLEVSSHALALGRVEDIEFNFAAFTNLQSDHLDFHGDRENYFEAKARIFDLLAASPKKERRAVLNADDERAPELLGRLGGEPAVLTFGINQPADFKASEIVIGENFTTFVLVTGGETFKVRLNLLGRHNVYNALTAITLATAGGLSVGAAVAGAAALQNVPGRLERVTLGQDFTVFVDYAHTDAALQNVLENLKLMPHARIITVVGCGGDRDRTKRAPMGRVCCGMSDQVIVTSDNPRSENPAQIFADIEAGVRGQFQNYEVIPDRGEAIKKAVALAAKGDILLIAGKGHETYQILKDRTIHFSDTEAAGAAIREKTERRKI